MSQSESSTGRLWAGRILTGLPIVFLLGDGAVKFTSAAGVIEAFHHLGLPISTAPAIGSLELFCTLLYAYPRTSILGAVLLTGYLGGATAIHVRIGDPFWFPILMGLIVWAGLYLRESRLHPLLPLSK